MKKLIILICITLTQSIHSYSLAAMVHLLRTNNDIISMQQRRPVANEQLSIQSPSFSVKVREIIHEHPALITLQPGRITIYYNGIPSRILVRPSRIEI